MPKKSKKHKKKAINILSIISVTLLLLISFILIIILLQVPVIPSKYMVLLFMIYIPIVGLLSLFLINKKIKKKIKICSIIMSTIITIFILFVCLYLNRTIGFMNKIKSKDYQIEKYYAIVLKNSPVNSLKELENKNIGLFKNESTSYDEALNKYHSIVTAKDIFYEDYETLLKDFLNNKIDGLFISEVLKGILEDNDVHFNEKIKIIETIEVNVQNKTVSKEANVTKETFNIYISGIDVYGKISSVSRSDVNIIATVNPTTHQVLLTSIPRDYYVPLHGKTGYKDKLTHAGIYGVDMSIKTLEDLLDIDINYYIRVNFTTLISLVDAIGGIEVESEYAFTAISGEKFKKGTNKLNGKQALAFSRERKAFIDGDRQRGKNQQKVLTAIINKTLSSKTLITKYMNILDTLEDSFETNMPSSKIYDLVNMQIDKMPKWTIQSVSLNGHDANNYTYSYPKQRLYVMEPNEQTVNAVKTAIKDIIDDKIIAISSYVVDNSKGGVVNQNKPTIDQPPKPDFSEPIDDKQDNIIEQDEVQIEDDDALEPNPSEEDNTDDNNESDSDEDSDNDSDKEDEIESEVKPPIDDSEDKNEENESDETLQDPSEVVS